MVTGQEHPVRRPEKGNQTLGVPGEFVHLEVGPEPREDAALNELAHVGDRASHADHIGEQILHRVRQKPGHTPGFGEAAHGRGVGAQVSGEIPDLVRIAPTDEDLRAREVAGHTRVIYVRMRHDDNLHVLVPHTEAT